MSRPDGSPAPGASVQLFASMGKRNGAPDATTVAAADGTFDLAGLRADTYVVAAGGAFERAAREVRVVQGPATVDLVLEPISKPRLARVRARVYSAAGEVVKEAAVIGYGTGATGGTTGPGFPDPDGSFEIDARPGTYVFGVYADAEAGRIGALSDPVPLAPGQEAAIEIRYTARATVFGHVELPAGVAADGLRVRLIALDPGRAIAWTEGPIQADGSYSVERVLPGSYRAVVAPVLQEGARQEQWVPTNESRDVTVRDGDRIRLDLGPARTGTVRFRVVGLTPRELENASIELLDARAVVGSGKLGLDGIFEAEVPLVTLDAHITMSEPQQHESIDLTVRLEIAPSGETVVEIPSARGTIRGGLEGAPAAILGKTVVIDATGRGVRARTTTDLAGAFRFPPLPPGPYEVSAGGVAKRVDVAPDGVAEVTVEPLREW